MNTSVFSQIDKTGVLIEGIGFSMLQNEPAFIFQDSGLEYPVWYLRYYIQVIRGVCKYYIILLAAVCSKIHCLGSDYFDVIRIKFLNSTLKKPGGFTVCFDHIHPAGSS